MAKCFGCKKSSSAQNRTKSGYIHSMHSMESHRMHTVKAPGLFSMFHRAFFNSIIDKTPTHALFNQHCISLAC